MRAEVVIVGGVVAVLAGAVWQTFTAKPAAPARQPVAASQPPVAQPSAPDTRAETMQAVRAMYADPARQARLQVRLAQNLDGCRRAAYNTDNARFLAAEVGHPDAPCTTRLRDALDGQEKRASDTAAKAKGWTINYDVAGLFAEGVEAGQPLAWRQQARDGLVARTLETAAGFARRDAQEAERFQADCKAWRKLPSPVESYTRRTTNSAWTCTR